MKYTFIITQTDTFSTKITVEAINEAQARQLLQKDLEDCPIDTRSNTLQSSEEDIELSSAEGES